MAVPVHQLIEMVRVDRINVVNPRVRNQRIFREIVANIAQVGLKKPITVTKHDDPDGPRYDLVCGQGRLEAYQSLGQTEIPALVIDAGAEDCAVMSLVENFARRQHRALDLLHDIQGLKGRGYDEPEIARKTGLTVEYVKAVIGLLENGEHRLLRAVESGHVPISVAIEISQADDAGVQAILQQAYENKQLRGRKLMIAKRLIEQRRRRGKGFRSGSQRREQPLSPTSLIRAYKEDVDRKRVLIRKANATRDRLIFLTEAIRKLFAEENFITLLRAEGLDTLPKNLADRIQAWARA
jgi:ParB family transcriptional regulator, chromosome partitioning protein